MRSRGWLVALALCAGCPAPDDPTDPCGPAAARLGRAGEPFVPLVDGEAVEIVRGPQGGWHFELAAELDGLGDPVAVVLSAVELDSGEVVSESWLTLAPEPAQRCRSHIGRMLAIFDVAALADGDRDTPPELLPGRALELRLTADDGAAVAEVGVEVVAVDDE